MAEMATNSHFGHSGQSEMSENGLNGFPMPKNLGIDTKIKSKVMIFAIFLPQMAILATQVSLRCLKLVPNDFPY